MDDLLWLALALGLALAGFIYILILGNGQQEPRA